MNLVIADASPGVAPTPRLRSSRTKAPVIENFGLRGFGSHSNDAEYIEIDSIEPRLICFRE